MVSASDFAVGFTGARTALTPAQLAWLLARLREYYRPGRTFHHGDCVGKDEAAAKLARELGYVIVSHPATGTKLRAYVPADELREPLPPLERNRVIVDSCLVLLAVPDGAELPRSGTWSTVRYARRVGCRTRNWWYERETSRG